MKIWSLVCKTLEESQAAMLVASLENIIVGEHGRKNSRSSSKKCLLLGSWWSDLSTSRTPILLRLFYGSLFTYKLHNSGHIFKPFWIIIFALVQKRVLLSDSMGKNYKLFFNWVYWAYFRSSFTRCSKAVVQTNLHKNSMTYISWSLENSTFTWTMP